MRRIIWVTMLFLIVGVFGTTACKYFKIGSQDEGPIIVQNGSMIVDTDSAAEWQDDSGGWKNATGKDHKGELWVRVDLTDGTTCKGSGHPVHVEYSATGFKAIFNPAGNPAYTKVEPKGQLNLETKQRLRHGQAGDGGYIDAVKINGQPIKATGGTADCIITKENLTSVNICSSSSVDKCQ